MKDPLSKAKSLLELLAVPAEISYEEQRNLVSHSIPEGAPINLSGTVRALCFEYPEHTLHRFSPTLSVDLSEFQEGKRYETGVRIERFFRTNFPADDISHMVHLFYHWSLKSLEENLGNLIAIANSHKIDLSTAKTIYDVINRLDDSGIEGFYINDDYVSTTTMKTIHINDPVPELDYMVKRYAQTAAILTSGTSYWETLLKKPASSVKTLVNDLHTHIDKFLTNCLARLNMQIKSNTSAEDSDEEKPFSNDAFVKRFAETYKDGYKLYLSELKLAEKMHQAILRYRGSRIHCGTSILKDFHLKASLQDQVQFALEQHPDSQLLKDIQKELSAFHRLVDMVEKQQFSAALAEINKMSDTDKSSAEIRDLSAVIHFNMGAKFLKSGAIKDMLTHWKNALKDSPNKKKSYHITEQMAKLGRQEAESRASSDLNKAIDILKTVNSIAPNASNKLVMANFIVKRAQKEINNLIAKTKKGSFRGDSGTLKHLKELVKDLERAVRVGHQGAKKHLKRAKQLLTEANSGLLGLPDKFRGQLGRAIQIAHLGDYEGAVQHYRKIIAGLGQNKSDQINRQLADTLLKLVRKRIDTAISLSSAQGALARGLQMRGGGSQQAVELLHRALNELQPVTTLEPKFSDRAAKLRKEIEDLLPKAKTRPLSLQRPNKPAVVTQVVPMNFYSSLKWLFAAFLFAMVTIIIILGQWKFLMILLPLLAVSVLISSSHSQKR